LLLPLECAYNTSSMSKFDCTNPERTSPDMVHTFVDIEVDDRLTEYSLCNLCTDGIDKISHKPCVIGEYQCNCHDSRNPQSCDKERVGVEDVNRTHGHETKVECANKLAELCGVVKADGDQCHDCLSANSEVLKTSNCTSYDTYDYCPFRSTCQAALDNFCGDVKTNSSGCYTCRHSFSANLSQAGCSNSDMKAYCPSSYGHGCQGTGTPGDQVSCWKSNIARKTGGKWFSPTKEGQCDGYVGNGTCGWHINSMFTVNDTCVRNSIYTNMESHAPGCFAGCGQRNVSSPCWVSCFFDTFLGPDAHLSTHADLSKGIPMVDVEAGYLNAFRPESEGGCPRIPTTQGGKKFII